MIKYVHIKPKPRRHHYALAAFDQRLVDAGLYTAHVAVEFTSVSDRLPDNSEIYLCSDGNRVFPMSYSEIDKRFLDSSVTHWADYNQFSRK